MSLRETTAAEITRHPPKAVGSKIPSAFGNGSITKQTHITSVDVEKDSTIAGTYLVNDDSSDFGDLKTTKDGKTILVPQPFDDPEDPLNWSWYRKHKVLLVLLLPSLLTDWGMTWGTTLFEAQAQTWGMTVPQVAASVSGGIFLQGPGGILAVPFVQRYGRLPVLFWSQFLATFMILGATFAPTYVGFTVLRSFQGFVGTAPQVIGLTIIHDMFFLHDHAVRINMWAFCFVIGPYVGPFISSFLLSVMDWRADMGVLAGFYALSTVLVVIFGEETSYDRNMGAKPTLNDNKFLILTGVAGAKAKGQPKITAVFLELFKLIIKPQLLLPCLYIMILFTWAIGIVTTITQFTRPPPYLLNDLDSSLFYLAPIVGSIAGEFWGHWFNDFVSNRYIKTHNGRYLPETRLWGVYAPAVLATTSLILYGQTLQHTFPVIALAAAWSIMAFAQVAATTAISVYALDSFPQQAALASSWINFFRTTGGFCVTYFQLTWVAANGPAVVFGCQAAIVAVAVLFVVATQVWGRGWRVKYALQPAEG